MKHWILVCSLWGVGVVMLQIGCVPSEETGAGRRTKSPVQVFGPIDTTHRSVRHSTKQDTVSSVKADTLKTVPVRKTRIAPKFRTRQDTVRAAMVTRSKLYAHQAIKIVRPEHPVYTIQVGAFGKVSNALRAQKKAKEHFAYQPVYNIFVKHAKLYRVSIGRYEDRKDVYALYDSLKQNYPDEYKLCWINFIP